MASNISPLAHVDPTAKLGDNVTIHPFAFIDADVEIGDGCEIMSYTSIIRGSRMGRNNRVYQGTIIGATRRISAGRARRPTATWATTT